MLDTDGIRVERQRDYLHPGDPHRRPSSNMTKTVSRRDSRKAVSRDNRRRSEIPSDEFDYEAPRKNYSPRGSPGQVYNDRDRN